MKDEIVQPYKHDCDVCQWVGWYSGGKRLANIYICKGGTVIIRYSDKPSDYWSCSIGTVKGPIKVAN